MALRTFYQDLTGFTDFRGITREENFVPVPEDWQVVVTDVRNSTKAIEDGRYKEVNTIGAAAIVAADNAMGGLGFPYVFGGDGATFLMPPDRHDAVKRELVALKRLSRDQFGLELRAGVVDMKEIHDAGGNVEVAKLTLTPGRSVAIFRGGGLTIAEKLVKGDSSHELNDDVKGSTNLQRLSCRWKPVPAKRGRSLSLLVAARGDDGAACYEHVLTELEKVFDGHLEQANPISRPQMSYHRFIECYRIERRLHRSVWSLRFLLRVAEIFGAILVYRFGVPPLYFNAEHYAVSTATHSDYRKFDDMLRMVIDCSPEQVKTVRTFLEQLHKKGEICYGMHEAPDSLMTCFIDSLSDGNHIHFIDGGNGGYAMAAKQLKAQIRDGFASGGSTE